MSHAGFNMYLARHLARFNPARTLPGSLTESWMFLTDCLTEFMKGNHSRFLPRILKSSCMCLTRRVGLCTQDAQEFMYASYKTGWLVHARCAAALESSFKIPPKYLEQFMHASYKTGWLVHARCTRAIIQDTSQGS